MGHIGRHHRHVGMDLACLMSVHAMSAKLTRVTRSPIRFQFDGFDLGCLRALSSSPE